MSPLVVLLMPTTSAVGSTALFIWGGAGDGATAVANVPSLLDGAAETRLGLKMFNRANAELIAVKVALV